MLLTTAIAMGIAAFAAGTDPDGFDGPPPVAELIARLEHADAGVRLEAAAKLRDLGPAAAPAVVPLAAALSDTHYLVRRRAVEALRQLGPPAACIAAASLSRAVGDSDAAVARASLLVLWEWRHGGDIRVLTMNSKPTTADLLAAGGDLRALRGRVAVRTRSLQEALNEVDLVVSLESSRARQTDARRMLAALKTADADRALALLDSLTGAVGNLVSAIERIESDDFLTPQLLPSLYRHRREIPAERQAVLAAAARVMQRHSEANAGVDLDPDKTVDPFLMREVIAPALLSRNEKERVAALRTALAMKDGGRVQLPELIRHLRLLANLDERLDALDTILRIGRGEPSVLELLRTIAASEPSFEVRAAALRALGDWPGMAGTDTLLNVIADEKDDPEARIAALGALNRLVQREGLPLGDRIRELERLLADVLPLDELRSAVAAQERLGPRMREARRTRLLQSAGRP